MLIKGTPDILKPPATPLGMSGLDAVPRADAATTSLYRTGFVQQYGQAALDRILSVWQSNAPDWEIIAKLREINNPNVYKAAGVTFEEFYAWWKVATAQESVLQTFANAGLTRGQRAQTIRFIIANTPSFSVEQAAAPLGMTATELASWLEGSDTEYAAAARSIVDAPVSTAQQAQMLEALAYKWGLSKADLARYLGQSLTQVSTLLAQAGTTPTYVGGGVVAQATPAQPGAALVGGVLALIPAGSSRVVDAVGNGAGGITVTTADGITAEIAPGPAGLRTVPITPQAWGRLEALQTSTALDYQAQSIAIYRALQSLGVSNPVEMNQWIPAGLDTVLRWLEVQGQTVVPPIESIGIQPPSWSQDVDLNQQFAAIFNDANRSRSDKASAWVALMRANNLGLNDVSRIVGVDARAVSEFLSTTDLATSAEVPKLINVEVRPDVGFDVSETLYVPVYTRQVAPTGSGGEIPVISGNLAAMNAAQKAAEYLRLIDLGWADSQIRDAVTLDYGDQADSDWVALRNLAAAQRAAEIAAKAAADAAAAAAAAQDQANAIVAANPQSSAAATTTQQAIQVTQAATTAIDAAQAAATAAANAADAADAGDTAGVASASTTAQTAAQTAVNAQIVTTPPPVTEKETVTTPPAAGGGVAPLLLAVAAAYILGA